MVASWVHCPGGTLISSVPLAVTTLYAWLVATGASASTSLLTTEELRGREASAYRRRLKSARFPITKTPEDFDFLFQPSLTPERILQLKDCRWVANASFSRGKAEPEKVIWP
jgi:hypothetical protein